MKNQIVNDADFISKSDIESLGDLLLRCSYLDDDRLIRKEAASITVFIEALGRNAATWDQQRILYETVERMVERMQLAFGAIEQETVLMTRLFPGALHVPHADNQLEDGTSNHTPFRSHVGLLYLKRPEEGGELRVWDYAKPETTRTFTADPGRFVAFPGTREFFHEVTQIKKGERWTLAMWTKTS